MRLLRVVIFALFAVVIGLSGRASAQGTTGSISGFVNDPSAAGVPGATITVKNVETGQTRVLVSDNAGRYRAQELAPGRYDVTVELVGFQTAQYTNLPLTVGQNMVVNVTLKLGGLDEKVTVTGEAEVVNTRQSSVAALVDQQQIRELPLNGRDFSQLTLLQAGVTWAATSTASVDRGMGTQVSVAGARPNQISFQLDGTDINTQGNGAPGSAAGGLLGVETVREFQVLVNNYSAEYGRSSGGIVTAVTRSGTNDLHGSAFEFYRGNKLDSPSYFDKQAGNEVPPYKRNQYGGFLGGPIVKDKTFFFGSYEGLRQDKSLTNVADVPSMATRSGLNGAISPVTKPYLLLYPEPNGPVSKDGLSAKYFFEYTEPTRENYVVGKVDQTLSSSQSFSVRYSRDHATLLQGQGLGLWSDNTVTTSQFLVGEHKWILSSSLLNTVKVAWNKAYENTETVDLFNAPTSLYIFPNTQFPAISISPLTDLGADSQTPTFVDLKSLQIIDNFTWARGAHNVKTGIAFTRWYNDQNSSFDVGGNYVFSSIKDFLNNNANAFEGQTPGSSTERHWRENLVGLYLQDDWSVKRNVTLNAGLRYEFITEPKETTGKMQNMRNLYDTAPTVGRLFVNPSLKNFAPRVGFAWDVTGDGKNAVHGGAGYFFEPIMGNVYRTTGNRNPPFYQLYNPSPANFPNPFATTGGSQPLLRLDLFDYEPKNPYRIQYNATYQRQLAANTAVTVGFVGSRGFNQIINLEWNQAIGLDASGQPCTVASECFFTAKSTRRNPTFGSMRLRHTAGKSWYKGFIASANRRFSGGLALQASFTMGQSIDQGSQAVGSGDFSNGFQARYPDLPADNQGLSDFNVKKNFVFNYSWELPFAKDATGAKAIVAYGWQLSGIVTLRDGVPFSPVMSFDRAHALPRSGGAGQRPDLNSGCSDNPVLGGADKYFDTSCFSMPAEGTFGNLGRNTIIGPGFATWDMAVFKNFRLPANRRIQVRIEGFNILNRANFGLPKNTVFTGNTKTQVFALSPTAGQITSTVGTPREFQLGVKFEF